MAFRRRRFRDNFPTPAQQQLRCDQHVFSILMKNRRSRHSIPNRVFSPVKYTRLMIFQTRQTGVKRRPRLLSGRSSDFEWSRRWIRENGFRNPSFVRAGGHEMRRCVVRARNVKSLLFKHCVIRPGKTYGLKMYVNFKINCDITFVGIPCYRRKPVFVFIEVELSSKKFLRTEWRTWLLNSSPCGVSSMYINRIPSHLNGRLFLLPYCLVAVVKRFFFLFSWQYSSFMTTANQEDIKTN